MALNKYSGSLNYSSVPINYNFPGAVLTPLGEGVKAAMTQLEQLLREYTGYTGPHPIPSPTYSYSTGISGMNTPQFTINTVTSTNTNVSNTVAGSNYIYPTNTTDSQTQSWTWSPPPDPLASKFTELWNKISPLITQAYQEGHSVGYVEGREHGHNEIEEQLERLRDVDLDKRIDEFKETEVLKVR